MIKTAYNPENSPVLTVRHFKEEHWLSAFLAKQPRDVRAKEDAKTISHKIQEKTKHIIHKVSKTLRF